MNRSEVWWVDFDPSVGGEIQKLRPAVIVSNNAANRHMNRLQVVPISSKVANLYPGETYVTLNGQQRKAITSQITTVSKLRVQNQLGMLSGPDLTRVEKAIRVQLGLWSSAAKSPLAPPKLAAGRRSRPVAQARRGPRQPCGIMPSVSCGAGGGPDTWKS